MAVKLGRAMVARSRRHLLDNPEFHIAHSAQPKPQEHIMNNAADSVNTNTTAEAVAGAAEAADTVTIETPNKKVTIVKSSARSTWKLAGSFSIGALAGAAGMFAWKRFAS